MPHRQGPPAEDSQKRGSFALTKPKRAKIVEEFQPLRESRPRRAPAKKYDRYLEEEPERPVRPKEVSLFPKDQDSHSDPHIEASQEKLESPEQPSHKAEDPLVDEA